MAPAPSTSDTDPGAAARAPRGMAVPAPRPTVDDEWIVQPMLAALVGYHALQLCPQAWLPSLLSTAKGYPSDLFLLLQVPTSVPARVLRAALAPGGRLSSSRMLAAWKAQYGDDAIEALLTHLSQVETRVRRLGSRRNGT